MKDEILQIKRLLFEIEEAGTGNIEYDKKDYIVYKANIAKRVLDEIISEARNRG